MGTVVTVLLMIGAVGLGVQALIGLSFFISCILEKERRATVFAGLQFLAMIGVFVSYLLLMVMGFFRTGPGLVILIAGYVLAMLAVFLLVRRTAPNPRALQGTKGLIKGEVKRQDERAQVFARNRSLRPGSEQYTAFYLQYPEYEEYDKRRRQLGGPLGHPGVIDKPHEGPNVAATLASQSIPLHLSTPDAFNPQPHPELKGKRLELSAEEATERVKGYARSRGADLVGISEINPLWVYSYRGEIFHESWDDWGKDIRVDQKYAIVFATQMSFEMVGTGPHSPTMIESMGNYAQGAYIATQLAHFIANLGYSATASHLRHYDALMVPLAVDAGLGELGRLGYLITKEFGPRVRLGAVTTDLPLVPDEPIDIGVEDFCRICKKCAMCCPSSSIPEERDQTVVNGSLRWKLNDETCFEYWGRIGTDCNICMRVCPWSHARTFPHKLIVMFITRNRLARRIFSVMDDIFYAKKPKVKPGPKWVQYRASKSLSNLRQRGGG
ncbi:MAG TPA: reductive dehalogenase [Desulfatiglandales bacterium]|nr:reductive dehalogenase [Desulfatiglandales bacterium]